MAEIRIHTFPKVKWCWVDLNEISTILGLDSYWSLARWWKLNFAANELEMVFTQGERIEASSIQDIAHRIDLGIQIFVPLGWWKDVESARKKGYDGCMAIDEDKFEGTYPYPHQLTDFWDDFCGGSDTRFIVLGTKNWSQEILAL